MASIRKLPSWSWCVQIRVKGLKPITRTSKTKGNAREFAKQVENEGGQRSIYIRHGGEVGPVRAA
jgi:hypothetical protein